MHSRRHFHAIRVVAALILCIGSLFAQSQSPAQTLAAMEKCREQVIQGLAFSEKMKMKAAMSAIQGNPEFVEANKAVQDARTPEAQVEARKALAKLKLSLIEKQDPSLKPVVQKIRDSQGVSASRG